MPVTTFTREACAVFYSLAAATPTTGDRTKWPDVLAFKHPITDLHVLMQHIGIFDADLRELISAAADAFKGNGEDRAALTNLITASMTEQQRRIAELAQAAPRQL